MTAAHEWIPDIVWAKLDASLRREMVAVYGGPAAAELPVLMVVGSGPPSRNSGPSTEHGGRVAAVAAAKAAFERDARPVLDRLATLSAREVRALWINNTIAARITSPTVITIGGMPEVRRLLLDSPRPVLL